MIDGLLLHKMDLIYVYIMNCRMEDHIRILKEVYVMLDPLNHSQEEYTHIIRQASAIIKTLKTPLERTPEFEDIVYKIRRRMFGYTD